MARKRNRIQLTPFVKGQVDRRQEIIAEHELILRGLRLELDAYLKRELGVDLQRENWEYDPRDGVLVRLPRPGEVASDDAEG